MSVSQFAVELSPRQATVARAMFESAIKTNKDQLLFLLGPDHPDDKELKESVQKIAVAEILLRSLDS